MEPSCETTNKGRLFKVQCVTGKQKHLVVYKTFSSFVETCKKKFQTEESDEVTFETYDGNFQVDEESIEYLEEKTSLVMRVRGNESDSDMPAHVQQDQSSSHNTGVMHVKVKECDRDVPEQVPQDQSPNHNTKDSNQTAKSRAAHVKEYAEWRSKAIEAVTAGKEKITKHIKEYGEKSIEKIVRDTLNEESLDPLSIAVIGRSGNGKSSLINAIRGVTKGDPTYAHVGTTETTLKPSPYPHPYYKNMVFWDIPGVGTRNNPKYLYLSKIKEFDFFIICSSSRFSDDDRWLASEIKKMDKIFYFLRTKVDNDLQAAKRELGSDDYDEKLELQKIETDCKKNLMSSVPVPIFLVSNWETRKYDFPKFTKRLTKEVPDIKRRVLVLGLISNSEEVIKAKVTYLRGEIWKVAFLSGLGGAIPIPVLSYVLDMKLILSTVQGYGKQFQLTTEHLTQFSEAVGLSLSEFRKIVGMKLSTNFFTAQVLKGVLTYLVTSTIIEEGASFIPVIGSVVSAGISYKVTGNILSSILDDCEHDAIAIFKFLANKETEL